MQSTQVLALSAGLPAAVVDAVLTATEAALLRAGASRIRVDTSQPGVVVLADLPTAAAAAAEAAVMVGDAPAQEMEVPAQRTFPEAMPRRSPRSGVR